MKRIVTPLLLLALPVLVSAQIENPVKWTFTSKKINDKTYELHITATIETGWHLYAQETGEGPLPTTFKFVRNPLVTTTGKVKESGKLHKSYDKYFGSEVKYYENQVNFIQTVTLKGNATTNVKGSVEYIVCDDKQCMPPKETGFSIAINKK